MNIFSQIANKLKLKEVKPFGTSDEYSIGYTRNPKEGFVLLRNNKVIATNLKTVSKNISKPLGKFKRLEDLFYTIDINDKIHIYDLEGERLSKKEGVNLYNDELIVDYTQPTFSGIVTNEEKELLVPHDPEDKRPIKINEIVLRHGGHIKYEYIIYLDNEDISSAYDCIGHINELGHRKVRTTNGFSYCIDHNGQIVSNIDLSEDSLDIYRNKLSDNGKCIGYKKYFLVDKNDKPITKEYDSIELARDVFYFEDKIPVLEKNYLEQFYRAKRGNNIYYLDKNGQEFYSREPISEDYYIERYKGQTVLNYFKNNRSKMIVNDLCELIYNGKLKFVFGKTKSKQEFICGLDGMPYEINLNLLQTLLNTNKEHQLQESDINLILEKEKNIKKTFTSLNYVIKTNLEKDPTNINLIKFNDKLTTLHHNLLNTERLSHKNAVQILESFNEQEK